MAQTAIRQLIDWIECEAEPFPPNWEVKSFAEGLLAEEKEQIESAWVAGREFGCKHDDPETAEEYYNRTYKSEIK